MTDGFNTNRELFDSNDQIKRTQVIGFIGYEFALRMNKFAKEFAKQNRIAYKKFVTSIDYWVFCYNYCTCVKEGDGLQMEKDIMAQMDPEDNEIIADFNDNDIAEFVGVVQHHMLYQYRNSK